MNRRIGAALRELEQLAMRMDAVQVFGAGCVAGLYGFGLVTLWGGL